ncbi:hypothetical protein AYO20_04509 [Fonsecaea nubica]|uniref:Uncharacterized protein n=1 Tax=Fonsecaea nubica TaxID=856822 RepID=A0A178D4R5_9EURO|nr:hypothetical protein AYO20_04509 [Fonsecaea nubica]OAL36095.1 hypothetical protein AYO20_04509 [Fonsecaea nubica]
MVNQFTINVVNNSGSQQNYAFFTEIPKITGKVQNKIWQNVFVNKGAADSQTVSVNIFERKSLHFPVSRSLSSQGTPADGVTVSVAGMAPVTLGIQNADGTQVPGTTLPFTVVDQVPQFGPKTADSSFVNAFEIDTDGSFTTKDAQNNHYVVGLGGSAGGGKTGPTVTFVPEPHVQYQIQPTNTYWVTFGDYTPGNIIDVTKIGMKVSVDFTKLPNNVTIKHDEHGNLTVQKSS